MSDRPPDCALWVCETPEQHRASCPLGDQCPSRDETTPAPPPPTDGVDAALVRYLAARDHTRANQAAARMARLTDRERQLLREAAVMGYVHGWMDGQVNGRPGTPISLSDSQIVATVVIECANHSDRYPLIGEHQADDDSNERPDMEER